MQQQLPPPSQAEPLTAVALLCASRDGLSTLAPQISAFINPVRAKRWTIERACERGFLGLLQRLADNPKADTHPKPQLYRSHMFSRALVHAVKHDNDIALLECLRTYCPDGFASLGMEEAARVGKLSVMQWLDAHYEAHIIWSSRFAMAAASNGHLDVLQWLATKFPATLHLLRRILDSAARSGYLACVQFLFEQAARDRVALDVVDRQSLFFAACDAGNFEIAKYIHDEHNFQPLNPTYCIGKAARSGNLALVQWLHAQGYRDFEISSIGAAVASDHVDVMRWLAEHDTCIQNADADALIHYLPRAGFAMSKVLYAVRPDMFTAELLQWKLCTATVTGDIGFVQWVLARIYTLSNATTKKMYYAVGCAATNGHLEIVKFLLATYGERDNDRIRAEEDAVSGAATNGHVEVVQWLHANRTTNARAKYNIHYAVANGNLELVQWLLANADCSADSGVYVSTALSGNLAALEWVCAWKSPYYNRPPTSFHGNNSIDFAVRANHMHIVQWLHDNNCEGWYSDVMDMATSLEMVEWFHNNRNEGCTTKAMDNAAARGDFDTLLFLHEHRSEGCTVEAAALAQINDHLLVAQWLIETYPSIMAAKSIMEAIYRKGMPQNVVYWAPQLAEQHKRAHWGQELQY